MCSFDYPRIYSLIFNHSRTVSFVISGWALDGCGVPGTGCTRVRAITYSYGLLVSWHGVEHCVRLVQRSYRRGSPVVVSGELGHCGCVASRIGGAEYH